MSNSRILSLLAIILVGFCSRGAIAQDEPGAPTQASFNYVLGKTKLSDLLVTGRGRSADGYKKGPGFAGPIP